MFPVECQTEMRGLAISILLLYEFESKTLNERFLWNAWKQVKNKNKILQEERNFMIMGCEMGTLVKLALHVVKFESP